MISPLAFVLVVIPNLTLRALALAPKSWLEEHAPAPLLARGPLGLALWQWVGLLALILGSWLIAIAVRGVTRAVLSQLVRRTVTSWDEVAASRLRGPLTLGWSSIAAQILLPLLDLPQRAEGFVGKFLKLGLFFAFFWALLRALDILVNAVATSQWTTIHPASRSLVPLGSRIAKVGLFAMAVVAILAELGYPVASLIAGLGIGGIALALAAQKTVENLFGAFSIGVDQPFREGDFVKVEDFVGKVETIGLRSTRFRTLDRTLITIPNGKLAEMRIENFAPRDRIRLATVLGLACETSVEQMGQVLLGFERALKEQPKLFPGSALARFKEITTQALNVEIAAVFETRDFAEFQQIQQDVLLAFLRVVENAGTSFAFPTRVVNMVEGRAMPEREREHEHEHEHVKR